MKATRLVDPTLIHFCLFACLAQLSFAQTNPIVIGVAGEYWGDAVNLDLSGNYVFLSSHTAGGYMHWIYNVANPTNPIPVGPMSTDGDSMTVSGGYAYVANSAGVYIYDISNPTNAHTVGLLTNSGDVAVSGNIAYVPSGLGGLYIWDVSEPTNPVPIGHTTNNYGGVAKDVAISGDYAYVANYTDGLRIYDVSNSTNPFSVGPSGLSTNARLITVSGNYAYVGGGGQTNNLSENGTTICDITSPTNPVRGGHIPLIHGEASISGNYLYIANDALWIFDVSSFHQPVLVGYYNDGSEQYTDVKVRGNYAYVSGSRPLFVFWLGTQPPPQVGISQAANSSLVLSWPTPSVAFSVQMSTDLSTGNWVMLTNTPIVVGSQNQVTLVPSSGTVFYRLVSH